MMDVFKFSIPDTYIGQGAAGKIPEVVDQLGGSRVLLMTDPGVVEAGIIEKITTPLEKEKIPFGVFDGCRPNAPIGAIEAGIQWARQGAYDLIVGIGGGSVMDSAKLASTLFYMKDNIRSYMGSHKIEITEPGLPRVLVPTTAGSGSEWGRGAIIKDEVSGQKDVVHSDFFLQHHVIIDPDLMLCMPSRITGDTGIDALSHAIMFYSAVNATVLSDMFCEKAIELVSDNLPGTYTDGEKNINARYHMAIAASMAIAAGRAMAPSEKWGGRLAHGLAYPLQDMAPIEMTHAVSVSLLLPHVMAFDMMSNLKKFARIAKLMGENIDGLTDHEAARKAVTAVHRLTQDVNMPQRMRDFGIRKKDISGFVDHMFSFRRIHVDRNCRKASRRDVTRIYESAW